MQRNAGRAMMIGCLASPRLQPKRSYARSAQMCPGFAMLPPLHPGWDSVLRTRISGGKVLYTRVAASGAALPLRYAWPRTRCIVPKTISVSSFGASLGSSRIVHHLLSTREAYNESVFHRCDQEALKRAQYRLRKQAAQLGFQLIPLQNG